MALHQGVNQNNLGVHLHSRCSEHRRHVHLQDLDERVRDAVFLFLLHFRLKDLEIGDDELIHQESTDSEDR